MLLKNIVNKLQFFNGKKGILSTTIVGSSMFEKDYRDIDVLIVVDNFKLTIKYINEFSAIFKKKYTICDDSYRFLINKDKEISIVFKIKDEFIESINNILEGKDIYRRYKNWAVGGFFPESLLKDMERVTLLWEDSNQIIKKIKIKIDKNKDCFFDNFSKSLTEEIDLKSSYLKKNSYNLVFENTLINDLQLAILRLVFAKEKIFFPGLKRYKNEIVNMTDNSRKIINSIENTQNFIKNLLKNETFYF